MIDENVQYILYKYIDELVRFSHIVIFKLIINISYMCIYI